MSALDLTQLQHLSAQLVRARATLKEAEHLEAALNCQTNALNVTMQITVSAPDDRGQRGEKLPSLSVPLVIAPPFGPTGYATKDHPMALAAVRRVALDHRIACAGKVEGIEFQIRKLTKSSAPAATGLPQP